MKRNEIIVGFLVSLAIVAVFFYKFFLFGHIPFPGDLLIAEYNPWKTEVYLGYNPGSYPNKAQYFDVLRQLYPWRSFAIDQLKQGLLPLWNPYNFSGSPLLANFQSAVLYPLNLIFLFAPFKIGWTLLVIVQPFLALFFTFLYCRKIGLQKLPSLFTAVSYSFSYFFIVWLEYNTIGHILAWMPFALLAIEHLLEKREKRWGAGLIFACFAIVTAGHIQLAGYVFVFLFAYILFRTKNLQERLILGTLVVLGVGVSAIQLIPGLELIRESARSPIPYSVVLEKILVQPKQLIMLIVPDFFGNPATRNYILQDTYVGKAISIGVIPFIFAILGLLQFGKERLVKFFAVLAACIVLYITKNPISAFLFHIDIPIISSSSPTLSAFLLSFSASMLAGYGMQAWIARAVSKRGVYLACLPFVVLFVLLWGYVSRPSVNIIPVFAVASASKELLLAVFLFGAGGILMYIGVLKKRIIPIFFMVLLLLHGVSVFRAFQKFNPFVPQELVFPNHHLLSFLENKTDIQRFWGYKAGAVEANFATQYSLFSPDGYDPLYPKRYGEFIQSSQNGTIASSFSLQNRSDAAVSNSKDLVENSARLRVLNALGVSYILDKFESASSQKDFPVNRFVQEYDVRGWKVYKDQTVPQRIRLVGNYRVFANGKEFTDIFFSESFDPSAAILLEKNIDISTKQDINSSVVVKQYMPNSIVLQTRSKTNQLLYVSDIFFPGWNAYIDDTKTEILRANFAFRSIAVPKGNHTVVMEYAPESVRTGLIISLLSIIISAAVLFRFRRGII